MGLVFKLIFMVVIQTMIDELYINAQPAVYTIELGIHYARVFP